MNIDKFQKIVTLRSGRKVLLRTPDVSDAQAFVDFLNQLLAEDTFIDSVPQTIKDEEAYIVSMQKNIFNKKEIHIIAISNEEKIGAVDLNYLSLRKKHVRELSIFIRKDFRNDGLGNLLIQEVLKLAKNDLNLSMIILNVFEMNEVATILYKKFDFKEYGRLPHAILYKGKYIDEVLYYKNLS